MGSGIGLASPTREGLFSRDEYAANFVLYAMQKESIYTAFSVSDSARNKIETVFSSRVNGMIDEMNRNNAEILRNYKDLMKSYGQTPEESQMALLAPYDKSSILQTINNVVENMRSGASAQDILEKTGYFHTFFKDTVEHKNASTIAGFEAIRKFTGRTIEFKPSQPFMPASLAGWFNSLTQQLGLGSQLTMKGISVTA